MELFRQVGLEDAVRAAADGAWKQGAFGGARRGATLVDAQPIIDIPAMRAKMAAAGASPTGFVACPQTWIEPVLRQALQARGGDVRFGHELVAFDASAASVGARVRGPDGHEAAIEADWLIGADGGRSAIRRQLGIGRTETPAPQHLVNIFFAADLARVVESRTFSQCEIANDTVREMCIRDRVEVGLFARRVQFHRVRAVGLHLQQRPRQPPRGVVIEDAALAQHQQMRQVRCV